MLAKKLATYEDLIALPDNVVGEIVDGELVARPRPSARHARVAASLAGELVGPFDRGRGGPGGWIVLFEPELHIVEQVLVPDVAAWRRAKMPEVPDVPFLELAPDWVCEILSPSTALLDRTRKMDHYRAAEVRNVWLLDPKLTTVEIYRLDGDGWRLVGTHAGATKVRAEPFEAFELDLGALWSP